MKNLYVFLFLIFAVVLSSCGSVQTSKPQPKESTPEISKPVQPETIAVEGGTVLEKVGDVQTEYGEKISLEMVPGQSLDSGDYSVKSKLPFIHDIAKIANCLLTKEAFFKEIESFPKYDYTTDSSILVAKALAFRTPVVVSTYCKKFTKTLAYRNVGSNVLYINTCKQWGISPDLLNTLWHERSHVVGYGHGDNSSKGKQKSVPYGTGNMAEKYFAECKVQAGVL